MMPIPGGGSGGGSLVPNTQSLGTSDTSTGGFGSGGSGGSSKGNIFKQIGADFKSKDLSLDSGSNSPQDYFDKDTGEYLGKGGTDEIRFISKNNWENGNLSSFSNFAQNAEVEGSVYQFYAEQSNLIPNGAKGCQFCGGLSDGWSTSNNDGILSFNFSPGSIGLDIHKSSDAINVIAHELGGHGSDFINGTPKSSGIDTDWEMRATNFQVNHRSWSGTSKSFKKLYTTIMENMLKIRKNILANIRFQNRISKIFYISLLFILFSCNQEDKFCVRVSEIVTPDYDQVTSVVFIYYEINSDEDRCISNNKFIWVFNLNFSV